jgi:hypothetical protein
MPQTIEFSIEQGDITSFDADVVALKYSPGSYGVDEKVTDALNKVGISIERLHPPVGEYQYLETWASIQARHALIVGVPSIQIFNYQHIREFVTKVLGVLANVAPDTRHLVMTIHGIGGGPWDEVEALLAQFAGYLDAIQSGRLPPALEYISVVELDSRRVERLRQALEQNLASANYASRVPTQERCAYHLTRQQPDGSFQRFSGSTRAIERAGIESEAKQHVFVAMPFAREMNDVFYYGIQSPVRNAGFVCERLDKESFLGDILDRIKKRIETASLVIAELSGANPNVYLEVGYAWGKGRPTVLLMKDEEEPRFDVSGQRRLKYIEIRDLEESLARELNELRSQGLI